MCPNYKFPDGFIIIIGSMAYAPKLISNESVILWKWLDLIKQESETSTCELQIKSILETVKICTLISSFIDPFKDCLNHLYDLMMVIERYYDESLSSGTLMP